MVLRISISFREQVQSRTNLENLTKPTNNKFFYFIFHLNRISEHQRLKNQFSLFVLPDTTAQDHYRSTFHLKLLHKKTIKVDRMGALSF